MKTLLEAMHNLKESAKYIEGQEFKPDRRDLQKMKEYWDKGSNPEAMANSVKDLDKALSRYFIACAMNWEDAEDAFYYRVLELVGWGNDDKYKEIMKKLKEQATNYEISDEFKGNKGTEEFPIDQGTEQRLRDWFPKLFKLLKQNNLEYKLVSRHPSYNETSWDSRNGRVWTIAFTLTVKFPNGNIKEYKLANHTSEGFDRKSYGVTCVDLYVFETTQQRLADAFQREIDKNS